MKCRCVDAITGTGPERVANLATRQGGGITFLICFVLHVSVVSYHCVEAVLRLSWDRSLIYSNET